MKGFREFREFFASPVFYLLAAVFLALAGYKFYSLLLSYIDVMSVYPNYIFGSEIRELMGVSISNFLFPKLFSFYAYLVLMAVPVLNMGIGYDRFFEVDKIELLATGFTETKFIIRKIFTTTTIVCIILVPTIVYPLILVFFTEIDFGMIFSSYIGIILLTFLSACVVSPLSVLKIPFTVSIFLNLVILLILYLYFLEPVFASFLFGIIRFSTVLFIIILSLSLIFFSRKIYDSIRIFV